MGCKLVRADNVHSVISAKGMLLKDRWFNREYDNDELKATEANETCSIVDNGSATGLKWERCMGKLKAQDDLELVLSDEKHKELMSALQEHLYVFDKENQYIKLDKHIDLNARSTDAENSSEASALGASAPSVASPRSRRSTEKDIEYSTENDVEPTLTWCKSAASSLRATVRYIKLGLEPVRWFFITAPRNYFVVGRKDKDGQIVRLLSRHYIKVTDLRPGKDHKVVFLKPLTKKRIFPCVFFNVKLCRCCSYHVVNVIMPLTFIVLIGFLQFTMEPEESTRIEVSLGLVMVCILVYPTGTQTPVTPPPRLNGIRVSPVTQFKFSVMSPDHTPTVAYSTVLDRYMFVCNIVVFLMSAENGFVRLVASNEVWYKASCDESTDVWLGFWEGLNVTDGTVDGASQQESRLFCATQYDFIFFMVILGIFVFVLLYFIIDFIYVRHKGSHLENVKELAEAAGIKVGDQGDAARAGVLTGSSRSGLGSGFNRSNNAISVPNTTSPIRELSWNLGADSASASSQPVGPAESPPVVPSAETAHPAEAPPPASPQAPAAPAPTGQQVASALVNDLKNADTLAAPSPAP